jgi:flagella basal body P-ring formation protein FlgA
MNGRPLGARKKVQVLVILTILAWATQTLLHQWGFGAEARGPETAPRAIDSAPVPALPGEPREAAEKFVPGTPRFAAGVTLELRGEATIYGAEVRLKQVCRWSDSDAAMFTPLAELIVTRFDDRIPYKSLGIEELKSTLHDAGVNLAAIKFSGPTHCTINRSDAKPDPDAALQQWIDARQGKKDAGAANPPAATTKLAPPQIAALPATRPIAPAADGSPVRSLRQALVDDLAVRLALPAEQLQVNFNPKDEHVLNLSEPQFRFNLEAERVRNLGDVSWIVLIVTDTGTQKVNIAAVARAWQNQVVIGKALLARQIIQATDVAQRRMLVDRLSDEQLLAASQIVGQQAARDLKPGMVVTSRMVDPVPLAKGGQFITITLNQGGIRVKTVGRAMEGGTFGQTIKVKNEATNDIYEIVLTGPQEGTLGAPASPAGENKVATVRE